MRRDIVSQVTQTGLLHL